MEEEWKEFLDAVLMFANEVCVSRLVGQNIRKASKWRNDKVRRAYFRRERFSSRSRDQRKRLIGTEKKGGE